MIYHCRMLLMFVVVQSIIAGMHFGVRLLVAQWVRKVEKLPRLFFYLKRMYRGRTQVDRIGGRPKTPFQLITEPQSLNAPLSLLAQNLFAQYRRARLCACVARQRRHALLFRAHQNAHTAASTPTPNTPSGHAQTYKPP